MVKINAVLLAEICFFVSIFSVFDIFCLHLSHHSSIGECTAPTTQREWVRILYGSCVPLKTLIKVHIWDNSWDCPASVRAISIIHLFSVTPAELSYLKNNKLRLVLHRWTTQWKLLHLSFCIIGLAWIFQIQTIWPSRFSFGWEADNINCSSSWG